MGTPPNPNQIPSRSSLGGSIDDLFDQIRRGLERSEKRKQPHERLRFSYQYDSLRSEARSSSAAAAHRSSSSSQSKAKDFLFGSQLKEALLSTSYQPPMKKPKPLAPREFDPSRFNFSSDSSSFCRSETQVAQSSAGVAHLPHAPPTTDGKRPSRRTAVPGNDETVGKSEEATISNNTPIPCTNNALSLMEAHLPHAPPTTDGKRPSRRTALPGNDETVVKSEEANTSNNTPIPCTNNTLSFLEEDHSNKEADAHTDTRAKSEEDSSFYSDFINVPSANQRQGNMNEE